MSASGLVAREVCVDALAVVGFHRVRNEDSEPVLAVPDAKDVIWRVALERSRPHLSRGVGEHRTPSIGSDVVTLCLVGLCVARGLPARRSVRRVHDACHSDLRSTVRR